MQTLILGLSIFFGTHLVPSLSVKEKLISRFGEGRYMMLFAVCAAIGLALIIYGKAHSDVVVIWGPPAWSRYIPIILMLPAFILFVLSIVPGNAKQIIGNPMLYAVTLFSFGHLSSNGDVASILLFGCFGIFAVLSVWNINNRGKTKARKKQPIYWDVIGIIIGIAAYTFVILNHQTAFGVPVLY